MNNSSETCKIPESITGVWLVVITTIGSIIFVISLVGNGLIIAAFIRTKSLRKPCNVLLTNMSLGDLVYCLVGFPLYLIPSFNVHLFCNSNYMFFNNVVIVFLLYMQYSNIAIVALERFVGTQFPFHYHKVTVNRCYILAAISWLFSLVYSLMTSLNIRLGTKILLPSAFIVAITFVLTFAAYCHVCRISRRHLNRDRKFGIRKQESKSLAAVAIAGVYAVFWLPLVLLIVNRSLSIQRGVWDRLAFLFPFTATCFNLLIYGYRMSDFRNAVKGLLKDMTGCGRENRIGPLEQGI